MLIFAERGCFLTISEMQAPGMWERFVHDRQSDKDFLICLRFERLVGAHDRKKHASQMKNGLCIPMPGTEPVGQLIPAPILGDTGPP